MRVLLDEQVPVGLAHLLQGHRTDTVASRGWAGVTNGELLQHMRGEYDVLVTMDRGIRFQQNLQGLPFGVLLIQAGSNRLRDLAPLVSRILAALEMLEPGRVHVVGD